MYQDDEDEEQEPEPRYHVTLYAACGMPVPIDHDLDRQEARDAAAGALRRLRRRGQLVSVLDKGERWESLDPDDACMVSDNAGILALVQYDPTNRRAGLGIWR